jgi:hypothetical protein
MHFTQVITACCEQPRREGLAPTARLLGITGIMAQTPEAIRWTVTRSSSLLKNLEIEVLLSLEGQSFWCTRSFEALLVV